jgi:hypothetical protein
MKSLAIITGASAGLGVDFARLAARDGYEPVIVARRKDRLEAVALEIQKETDSKVWVFEADLQASGAVAELWTKVKAIGQPVEVLVNNAGFGSNGLYSDLPIERELEMIRLNIQALVELTSYVLTDMQLLRKGYILNVGSVAGFLPGTYMATYYATKNFVNSWSEALHEELASEGIRVSVLAPGPTSTEFAQVAKINQSLLFKSGVASSQQVAHQGWLKMKRGQAVIIPGLKNKLMIFSLRFAPRWAIRKISALINRNPVA